MPYKDLVAVESVWQKTKDVVKDGNIVAGKYLTQNGKEFRRTNFPNKKFSHIAHVRPHAQNAMDTYPLPIKDKFTNLREYTKHCFWLNSSYVKNEIYLK